MANETKTEGHDRVEDLLNPRQAQQVTRVEAEPLPAYGVEQVDIDYQKLLRAFKDRAMFVDGVRKEALTHTRATHWIGRKGKDDTVTYSLMGPGAERIKSICPIGITNIVMREEKWVKEEGAGYTVYHSADTYLGTQKSGTMPAMGSCSSDDDFFSLESVNLKYNPELEEHRKYLESGEGKLTDGDKTLWVRRRIPAAEIDKSNVVKASLTQLVVNSVTRCLGIRNIGADELRESGIDVAKIYVIEYGSPRAQSGRLTPAEEEKRNDIKKWLMEMADGDEKSALNSLKTRTAFNDYKGCDSWERLTVKQINMHHERVKADYDKWREGSGQQRPPPQQRAQAKKAEEPKPQQRDLLS